MSGFCFFVKHWLKDDFDKLEQPLYNYNQCTSHWYKLIDNRPIVPQLDALPDDRALAIFSRADVDNPQNGKNYVDGYMVKEHPEKYKLKYFKIDVDNEGKLRLPLLLFSNTKVMRASILINN